MNSNKEKNVENNKVDNSNDVIKTTREDFKQAVDMKASEKSAELIEKALTGFSNSIKELVEVEKKSANKPPIIKIEDVKVPDKLGRYAIAIAKSKFEGVDFMQVAKDLNIEKYMNTSDFDAGGSLVPEFVADEIISYLYAQSVFRKAGAGILDMPNGNVKFPKFTSAITGYWKGEAKPTTAVTPTTGSITLTAKILAVDIPISNQLLRYSGANTAREIQNMIVQGLVTTEEKGFLQGIGSDYEPLGISSQIHADNIFSATASATAVQIKSELMKLVKALLTANVPFVKPAWFMHSREYVALKNQTDANSNDMKYSAELWSNNTLFGYPVYFTNNIEINSSGKTEIFLIDMNFVKIGQGKALELKFSENGSYYNGSMYVSGETTDESVFKASTEVDVALLNSYAGAKLTGVGYGA